ncbi:MAG: hypothetical protein M3O36_11550 [Myxococcota bacterium]|nr:hypothetical protein [Myxococcota bacterium]
MKRLLSVLALLAWLMASVPALADVKPPVVIWPTLTPAGDAPGAGPLHKPAAADKDLFERAQELDATLRDAVQDLGFTLYLAEPGPLAGHKRDEDLLERAGRSAAGDAPESGTWVVSPRVESVGGGQYVVRIVAVPPRGRELRVRVDTVPSDSVSVRGLVMMRDMLSPQAAAQAATEQDHERAAQGTSQGIMSPLRSPGRAVLAVNAALFGAFTAFSVQRASGSSDPRVLYPLLALGTGMGIGGALLVADEWDVSTGDAWFLAAGGWWSAASAFLIAAGHDVRPLDDRYAWGVGGGLVGLGLATFALTRTTMDEGDAMIAHSGGALGLLLGGASEFLYRGTTTNLTPHTGMGYGTAIGTLAAGILATQATVSPSRVLLIDVGAGGGALLGAAAASPLIFENQTKSNTREWLSAAIGGSVAGGIATWWLTRNLTSASSRARIPGSPSVGIIGTSASRGGSTPAYGVTWGGPF